MPPSPCCPPPTEGVCPPPPPPPVKVPFGLKMSEYHAEIAGNQEICTCHSEVPFRSWRLP